MTARLILISGWSTQDRMWDALCARLPEFRAERVPWTRLLCGAARLELGAGPVFLAGWSLGAMLALREAATLPGLNGLVLISGTACFVAHPGHPGVEARTLRAMLARLRKNPGAVLRDFARQCFAPETNEAAQADLLQQGLEHKVPDLASGLDALASLDLRRCALPRCPVLLLHGQADAIVPLAGARKLADGLPQARLDVLNGCGHALPLTEAGEVAERIRIFAHAHAQSRAL